MPNNPAWACSLAEVRASLGIARLEVVNDFVAIALGVPHLRDSDRRQIGGGTAVDGAPIGIIGPGTGLGIAGLLSIGGEWIPVESSGGHATMAAVTDREYAVLSVLRRRYGHASAEQVLSGP